MVTIDMTDKTQNISEDYCLITVSIDSSFKYIEYDSRKMKLDFKLSEILEKSIRCDYVGKIEGSLYSSIGKGELTSENYINILLKCVFNQKIFEKIKHFISGNYNKQKALSMFECIKLYLGEISRLNVAYGMQQKITRDSEFSIMFNRFVFLFDNMLKTLDKTEDITVTCIFEKVEPYWTTPVGTNRGITSSFDNIFLPTKVNSNEEFIELGKEIEQLMNAK